MDAFSGSGSSDIFLENEAAEVRDNSDGSQNQDFKTEVFPSSFAQDINHDVTAEDPPYHCGTDDINQDTKYKNPPFFDIYKQSVQEIETEEGELSGTCEANQNQDCKTEKVDIYVNNTDVKQEIKVEESCIDSSDTALIHSDITDEACTSTCYHELLQENKSRDPLLFATNTELCQDYEAEKHVFQNSSCSLDNQIRCIMPSSQNKHNMDSHVPSASISKTEYEVAVDKLSWRRHLSSSADVVTILFPDGNASEDEWEDDDDDGDEMDYIQSIKSGDDESDYLAYAETMKLCEVGGASDSDDGHSLSSTEESDRSQTTASLKKISDPCQWCKVEFHPPDDVKWKNSLYVDESWYGKPPKFFFNMLFDNNLMKYIAQQTAMYAMQRDGKDLQLQETELKSFLGILILSGIVKVPSYRMYWQRQWQCKPIARSLSRARFEVIKRYIHFSDNESQKSDNHPEFDKLYKIRPILDTIRTNCKKASQEEHQCIAQQIIPTKYRFKLKYKRRKSYRYGYKIIARAAASGYIYDFEVYTGKQKRANGESCMGMSSQFVMQLSEDIPKHCNYKLYFDKWFSSISLVEKLKENGILSLSTIRPNRLEGCILNDEKIKKLGSFVHMVETSANIIALKWYDNKSVHYLSTYAGIYPLDKAEYLDGKKIKHVDVPYAVKEYNKYIGGVALSDMLMKLHRINFRSKKWYMRIFFHLIDLSIVNAWLLYRRITVQHKENCISLCDFRTDIALGLLAVNDATKRGGPSSSQIDSVNKKLRKCAHPDISVRLDNDGHLPEFVTKKKRCKECIKGFTRVICIKCNVGLCVTRTRNCFGTYHQRQCQI